MVEGFPFPSLSLCLSDEEIGCHSGWCRKREEKLLKGKREKKKKKKYSRNLETGWVHAIGKCRVMRMGKAY